MIIITKPIIIDEIPPLDELQFINNYIKKNCSFPIAPISFNRLFFEIKEIKCDIHFSENTSENLNIYFYGTGGESARKVVGLTKEITEYKIPVEKKIVELCGEAGDFDVCLIGFSSTRGNVQFSWG